MGQVITLSTPKDKLNDEKNKNEDTHSYSFSYNFVYWNQCKYSQQQMASGYKLQDLYVTPKHQDLKHEILHNEIATVSAIYWKAKLIEAQCQQQTHTYKCLALANVDKFVIDWKSRDDHPSKYGFNEGDCMNISHLMVVIIYCEADEFQKKFSETYRKGKQSDNFEKIKERHSNFHHFAKQLKEAVEVFGVRYLDGNVERMYHGINKQMVFTSMQGHIHTVLSTTSSQRVAFQFADNAGLIVEMIPSAQLKYFNCSWLSRYSNEAELLFIGGWNTINFINIINHFGDVFRHYITSLRIIDNMTNGRYFEYDCSIWMQIAKRKTLFIPALLDTNDYDIPSKVKITTKRLIEHEFNRYMSTDSKYKTLPQYIDNLLHHICSHKQTVKFDWKAMNSNVLTEYKGGGYIGSAFLKSYFCKSGYDSINLDFITTLFPSVKHIFVSNLSSINTLFVRYILEFMQIKRKSKIIYFELRIAKESGNANLDQIHDMYHSQFLNIGFYAGIFDDIPTKTKAYVVRKKTY